MINTSKMRDLIDQHRNRYDVTDDIGEIMYSLERLLDLFDVTSEAANDEDEHAAMDRIRVALERCGR